MVRSHRCPATVSGSKSAETTEVSCLGKVQRVGQCREPGDLSCLALRRPFEGKGRRFLCVDPNQADWGFLCGLPPLYWPERCRCWGIRCKLAELGQRQRRSGPTRKHKATMQCSCGRMAYGSVRASMQTDPYSSRGTILLSAGGKEGRIGGKQNVVSSRGVASPIRRSGACTTRSLRRRPGSR